ncbi:ATP-binding protein [Zunongwangia sp. F363]|uniref:ATP-binding protein n=1 Tax=Autumnicola tepida TaxID=3075595 RepID=A0ABU3CBK7_9FLAO|nr:ATP-binding protein [Zunongwangia sp. F363]MDT0643728.1 ATP-binding protein [Zunongwangia sp. F363]
MTISELIKLKESEDRVEFKQANGGNISYNGGNKPEVSKRRRCILGYVTALANEEGGFLVFGIKESSPHEVVGTQQNLGTVGVLESNIYRDTGIRVDIDEQYDEQGKRVLIISVPSRPIGKLYKFEDVPLMRVGEELKPMSDQMYLKIIQEQEPDFSQKICSKVTIDDIDDQAVEELKQAYSKKQNNAQFLTQSKEQVLTDLDLISGSKVTYAALILLGKKEIIRRIIPQASIRLEYRRNSDNIVFDNRYEFSGPFFLETERLWEAINLRNGSIPIQEGPFIFDIPYFNQEVIREAINNAVAHRNYRISSEIVIKQSNTRLDIISPGGFPLGVSIHNLIGISSTPRNRLLTDILQKTGIVERSGQGVDKIYYQTLKEGKSAPNYDNSDDFQVELNLSATIEDQAFAVFIESVQSDLKNDEKLSVHEVIHLNQIRKNNRIFAYDKSVLSKLLARDLIEKRGKTSGTYYVLSKEFYEFADEKGKYSKTDWDQNQAFYIILQHLNKFDEAKMSDFVDLFQGRMTRKQVRNVVGKLVKKKELSKRGSGKGTYYVVGENYKKSMDMVNEALKIGLKKLRDEGKLE